jgi:hypothetical protein
MIPHAGVVCLISSFLQLVTEVRQQLEAGAGHAEAVEHVARNRLSCLVSERNTKGTAATMFACTGQ